MERDRGGISDGCATTDESLMCSYPELLGAGVGSKKASCPGTLKQTAIACRVTEFFSFNCRKQQ